MMKRETFAIAKIYVPVRRRDARSQEGAGDRREHAAGWPAKTDPGAAGRRTFRRSGRAASVGGVQATWRGNHRWIRRAGPPALTDWKILSAAVRGPPHLRRPRLHLRSCRCGATA